VLFGPLLQLTPANHTSCSWPQADEPTNWSTPTGQPAAALHTHSLVKKQQAPMRQDLRHTLMLHAHKHSDARKQVHVRSSTSCTSAQPHGPDQVWHCRCKQPS